MSSCLESNTSNHGSLGNLDFHLKKLCWTIFGQIFPNCWVGGGGNFSKLEKRWRDYFSKRPVTTTRLRRLSRKTGLRRNGLVEKFRTLKGSGLKKSFFRSWIKNSEPHFRNFSVSSSCFWFLVSQGNLTKVSHEVTFQNGTRDLRYKIHIPGNLLVFWIWIK